MDGMAVMGRGLRGLNNSCVAVPDLLKVLRDHFFVHWS